MSLLPVTLYTFLVHSNFDCGDWGEYKHEPHTHSLVVWIFVFSHSFTSRNGKVQKIRNDKRKQRKSGWLKGKVTREHYYHAMRLGFFSVTIIRSNFFSQLAYITLLLHDHHWHLTKDREGREESEMDWRENRWWYSGSGGKNRGNSPLPNGMFPPLYYKV